MTAPRQVFAGEYYFVTRRCTQRQFLLVPSEHVNQVYLYCLGEAAERFNISLCGWLPMSNHHHLLVRDNDGRLPEFLAHLHKMIAKALNAHWGRRENFWSSEQVCVVRCALPEDVLAKLLYTLANPVAAHLVERAEDWPGASSLRQNLTGEAVVVKRPAFFRSDGPMPEQVTLRVERPKGFEDLSAQEWADLLRKEMKLQEDDARRERAEKQMPVVGRRAVLAAQCTDRATTEDASDDGLRPVLACRNPELRRHLLAALLAFRRAYRDARLAWEAGDTTVMFPPGTYRMLFHGAAREALPATAVVKKTRLLAP